MMILPILFCPHWEFSCRVFSSAFRVVALPILLWTNYYLMLKMHFYIENNPEYIFFFSTAIGFQTWACGGEGGQFHLCCCKTHISFSFFFLFLQLQKQSSCCKACACSLKHSFCILQCQQFCSCNCWSVAANPECFFTTHMQTTVTLTHVIIVLLFLAHCEQDNSQPHFVVVLFKDASTLIQQWWLEISTQRKHIAKLVAVWWKLLSVHLKTQNTYIITVSKYCHMIKTARQGQWQTVVQCVAIGWKLLSVCLKTLNTKNTYFIKTPI